MDHLPLPIGLTSTQWKVPFVARPEYEYYGNGIEDFKAFPQLHGFNYDESDDLNDRSAEENAAFLQSWLFFGLISEILQTKVDQSLFLRHETGDDGQERVIVSTAVLKDLPLLLRESRYDADDGVDECPKEEGY